MIISKSTLLSAITRPVWPFRAGAVRPEGAVRVCVQRLLCVQAQHQAPCQEPRGEQTFSKLIPVLLSNMWEGSDYKESSGKAQDCL